MAHADTIKAQLQLQQQQRALQDAELEMERSRLELAVLIFPNFNENFSTVDDLENIVPLPSFQEVEAQAGKNNPEVQAALASLKAANQEVAVAWNSFLPSLGFDYFYGIDANHFAVNGVDPVIGRNVRNLGYAATATLELPIWSWGAGRSKVKSAATLRYQAGEAAVLEVVDAQNTLTLAQNALGDGQVRFRVTIANLQTLTGKF